MRAGLLDDDDRVLDASGLCDVLLGLCLGLHRSQIATPSRRQEQNLFRVQADRFRGKQVLLISFAVRITDQTQLRLFSGH